MSTKSLVTITAGALVVSALALTPCAQGQCTLESPYTVDGNTLFLLHMDNDLGDELGYEPNSVPAGVGFTDGYFDDGMAVEAGGPVYPPVINLQQGSLEFWIKPNWDSTDGEVHALFAIGNSYDDRIAVYKDGANNLSFGSSKRDPITGTLIGPAVYANLWGERAWAAGTWHHVAATWSGTEMRLIVDGVDVTGTRYNPDASLEIVELDELDEMVVGGESRYPCCRLQFPADAVFDEFRISDIPRACSGPTPVAVDCQGFLPPVAGGPVNVRGPRAIPFRAEIFTADGTELTAVDVAAPPVIQVWFNGGDGESVDVTDDALPVGFATEGNEFVYTDAGVWQYNLKTLNYTSPGVYTVHLTSGDPSEYTVDTMCVGSFIVR